MFNEAMSSRKVNGVHEQEKCKSYESSEWNDLQAIEDDVSTYASGSLRQRTLYVHKTCATDQQQMNFISDVVYDVVLGSSVNCLFYWINPMLFSSSSKYSCDLSCWNIFSYNLKTTG